MEMIAEKLILFQIIFINSRVGRDISWGTVLGVTFPNDMIFQM